MRSLSLFTLAAALPAVLAGTVTVCVQTGCPTYSTICKTSYGLTSAVCPTSTTTLSGTSTITVIGTATTTKMITVTPAPSIVSTTVTSTETTTTTLPSITNTISVTTTLTATSSDTSTVPVTTTTTLTSSTTVTTTTTTTPAGFTPVADTATAGAIIAGRALTPRKGKSSGGIQAVLNGDAYPVGVVCEVQVYVYETRLIAETTSIDKTTTIWATAMTTQEVDVTQTAAQPTITSTYFATTTSTVTVGPGYVNATTTLSTTSTTTTTLTTTSTATASTTTTLTFTATSTANGACQTNNVMSTFQYQGQTVVVDNALNNGPTGVSNFVSVTATDQFDCCNQCSVAGGCTGSAYLGGGLCLLFTYGDGSEHVCIQSQNAIEISYHTQIDENDTGFYISNGLCGYNYLGIDDTSN